MSLQLFTVDQYGKRWVDTDPTSVRICKVLGEALNEHTPYAIELVLREKRSRDVSA